MVKTVNFPKILCTVRALYTYSSTESSSLSFEEGDSIDVLNQLDSGWWDGWCKGNRGWFPSNYVEVISQSNSNSSININNYKQQQQTKKHTETAGFPGCSLNSVDTLTSRSAKNSTEFAFTSNTATTAREKNNTNNRKSFQSSIRNSIRTSAVANELDEENDDEHTPPLPEGWTMHIATDGRTKFYFNQRTGGLRYTHPALLESENEEDDSCCSVEQDKCDDESKLRIDTNEFGSRATAKQHGKNYSSCCNSIKCQCEVCNS
ncbi:hypothetical protein BDF20DRAFT_153941 [Mycotypha africana]|uniref:uncharacterized protein n=1 Tax=Mycotypha africana TaxID=64632 RepID=UPI002300A135|nr:uncharacterized protein BDF20DRAFT_153941 [Mycotypha africana]KAI8969263.1 hypothetical protein BDF20DRAFT_153941 [Mycotypha africana]